MNKNLRFYKKGDEFNILLLWAKFPRYFFKIIERIQNFEIKIDSWFWAEFTLYIFDNVKNIHDFLTNIHETVNKIHECLNYVHEKINVIHETMKV